MQREITHGVWEKIQTDEDCADNEELWKLPKLHYSEATHPTLQLWHICDTGSQSAGVPRLCAGKHGCRRCDVDLTHSTELAAISWVHAAMPAGCLSQCVRSA